MGPPHEASSQRRVRELFARTCYASRRHQDLVHLVLQNSKVAFDTDTYIHAACDRVDPLTALPQLGTHGCLCISTKRIGELKDDFDADMAGSVAVGSSQGAITAGGFVCCKMVIGD